jgi:hypothetical protein
MPDAAFYGSCVLYWLCGGVGLLFALKNLADPHLSDLLSPGAGSPLLGDSGRMLQFEVGPDGVQSKLMGIQAWWVEGLILGVGSIALFSCWSTSTASNITTAYCAPVAACYHIFTGVAYFPITGATEMVAPMLALGAPPLAVSVWRVHRYCDPASHPEYHRFLAALAAVLAIACGWVRSRADAHADEIALFQRVRDHFMQNGMAWSDGLEYPDGFQLHPKRWFFF